MPPRVRLFPWPREVPPSRTPGGSAEARDLDHALNALRRWRPDLSAGEPIWTWHRWTLILAPLACAAAMLFAPQQAFFVLATVLIVPFFCIVALRTAALWNTTLGRLPHSADESVLRTDVAALPRYSILVPIYDEAAVVPDLVAALDALDYPRDRLEIFLILESVDAETRAAVTAMPLPPHMVAVIVPDGRPRTKPRALNYALRRATGDLVVIYDAEDVPEPDQLRRAAALLATDPTLGCVQARLNVLNDAETWLTRGLMAQPPPGRSTPSAGWHYPGGVFPMSMEGPS